MERSWAASDSQYYGTKTSRQPRWRSCRRLSGDAHVSSRPHKVRRAVHLDPEPLTAKLYHKVEAVARMQHHLLSQTQGLAELDQRISHLTLQARRLSLCVGECGAEPL